MGEAVGATLFPESVARPQRAAASNPARRVLLRSVIFTSDRALISVLGQKQSTTIEHGNYCAAVRSGPL
ncbi:hypothetical protein QA639_27045 [Bradyrhizobium pachyrhizi]|uniref:hypothetical protein n=1 Tax=Bradyrhizobium pachyrhizi TaxID=280333 RepID=UPI0024B1563F|nr:hypothetical protein [Bradyrhizobium pachyrhizi]WFU53320.1 hypothetical protein QA639_27045 [Bradyrhizobium pachyrhizi]